MIVFVIMYAKYKFSLSCILMFLIIAVKIGKIPNGYLYVYEYCVFKVHKRSFKKHRVKQ